MKRIILLFAFLLFATNSYATNYCDQEDAIVCFDIEEGSGTVLTDGTGNGNTGNFKASGAPAWSTDTPDITDNYAGAQTYSIDFDGSDDYVAVAQTSGPPIYSMDSPWSVCMWVNMAANQNGEFVYSEGRSTVNNNPYVGFAGLTSSSSLRVHIRQDNGTYALLGASTSDVFDGTWHHVCFTDDGAGLSAAHNAKLYVDGALDDTKFIYTPVTTISLNLTSLGALRRNVDDYFANCYLDEFLAVDTELTITSVNSIMTYGVNFDGTEGLPLVTSFDADTLTRTQTIDIDTFEGWDESSVAEYLITESASTPDVGDANWSESAPTTYTTTNSGTITLYAWVKDDEGNINETPLTDDVNFWILDGQTSTVWANNGEDKVMQHEVRNFDYTVYDGTTTVNENWDGTTVSVGGAGNSFSNFSVYIEAGDDQLTNVSVEMSDLVNGGNTIDNTTRATTDLFDFTQTDIEVFYMRYLQILGLNGASTYGVTNYPEDRWAVPMQRPSSPEWVDSDVYYPGYYKDMADAGTLWEDRPGADKYFPDIMVPYELEPTFNIATGTTQQIWVDIWIPKDTVAGTYEGTFTVNDDGSEIHSIPVELDVYDFNLPDRHYFKTWGFIEDADMWNRYFNDGTTYNNMSSSERQRAVDVWRHTMMMLKRHGGISYAGVYESDCTFTDNVPANDYRDFYSLLDGDMFTLENGYDGPGIGLGQDVWVAGTYGRWQNINQYFSATSESFAGSGLNDLSAENYSASEYSPTNIEYKVEIDGEGTPDTFKWSDDGGSSWDEETVEITGAAQTLDAYTDITFGATTGHTSGDFWTWSSLSEAEAAAIVQTNLDRCYTSLEAFNPGMKKMLWLSDEPSTEASFDAINTYSGWGHGATGGGENVDMFVTGLMTDAVDWESDEIDVAVDKEARRDYWNRLAENSPYGYVYGFKYYKDYWLNQEGKEIHTYVGPWDTTFGYTRIGWQQFIDGYNWNLLWHLALWKNNEGGTYNSNEFTRLFVQASTLGPSPPSTNDSNGIYGYSTTGNGNGVLIYPGTDKIGRLFSFTDSVGEQDQENFYCDDGDGTTARCTFIDYANKTVWISAQTDEVDDFEQGDVVTSGSWSATLTNDGINDDNYEINGPIASQRLKAYRNTVQDYDYLKMASDACPSCVNTILSEVGIINTHYKIYDWRNISYGGTGRGWGMYVNEEGTYDQFERARKELADIILGTNPPSKFRGSLNGMSK